MLPWPVRTLAQMSGAAGFVGFLQNDNCQVLRTPGQMWHAFLVCVIQMAQTF